MTNPHATSRAVLSSIVLRALCVVLLKGLLIVHAVAQSSATDTKTPPALAPGASAGSYALSGFDNINLYSGGLNFRLPLLRVGGRGGASYTMMLPIEQKWRVDHTFADQGQHWPNQNWWTGIRPGYGPGVMQGRQMNEGCPEGIGPPIWTMTTLTFTAPDGTEYELRDEATGGNRLESQCFNSYGVGASRGTVFKSFDGSAATFISDTTINDWTGNVESGPNVIEPTGYLMLRDGTRYRIESGKVMWMRDRNGNQLTFEYNSPYGMTRVTDSLGRQVNVEYDVTDPQYGFCDRISFTGFGGAARKIWVAKTTLANALRTTRPYDIATPQTYAQLFLYLTGSSTTQHNPGGTISSVWLPDGRRYQLFYNTYSELARVVLPTGGAFEYDWGEGGGGTICSSQPEIRRRVTERRVYRDGSTLEGKMTYGTTVDSLDANGTLLARSKHYFHDGACPDDLQYPLSHSQWNEGKEYQTEEYAADGVTALRKINHTWQQTNPSWHWSAWTAEASNNPKLVTTLTTIEPNGVNLVTKQTAINPQTGAVGFDQFNNQTDAWEYDYGTTPGTVGSLVRRSHTDYVTAAVYVNADANPALGAHLRALPSQQWVSSDAGGSNIVSRTVFEHDNYSSDARHAPLIARSGITGHDAAYTASFTVRGNVTGATSYADAAAQTGPVVASTQYDVAGNAVKSIDALGNASTITYADSFCNGSTCGSSFISNTYAFPTSATSPVPDPSGQHGSTTALATSTVYDFWTGLTFSTTDANNKTATLSYADGFGVLDPLDRLKSVTRADGSRLDFNYFDTPGNLYVQTLNDLDATRRTEARQYFDGLGRGVRSFSWENQDAANPWLTADTEYDALGRAWRGSNQYRSSGPGSAVNPSGRWTQTTFDALGRATQIKTTGDNAVVTTSYSGNTVTVTDQAGKKRKSVSDALGRLTSIYEDPLGLNYQTSYSYDALGNLRKVDQGGQLRFFMYDSLGRLIRAKNPEQDAGSVVSNITDAVTGNTQWSLAYGYDSNGNLTARVDARGVTTSYTYDNLNRNKTATYTGGGTSTPTVSRFYDNAATGANGLGRLHKTEAASTAQTIFTSYDVMGRPTQYEQKFWAGGPWGQAFPVQHSYNKGGGVTSVTYPSQRIVNYNYDAAGRIGDNGSATAFSGNLGDGVARTYSSEVRYQEMGGMEQERFDTQTPVYNKRFFNVRGQMNEIRVSTYSILASGQQTNWNRGAILNVYSANPSDGWTASGEDNNGNLRKQMLYVPNDDAITGFWDTALLYDYDALNRLDTSREVRGGANYWVQDFDYDRWGTRTINQTNTTGIAPEPQFSVNTGTNRLGVPSGQSGQMVYDAAGNLTTDTYQGGVGGGTGGGTRTYDAENRMTAAQFVSGQLQTASYTYDGDGRRIKRDMGAGGEVWQVYGMGGELLAEYAPNASPTFPQKEYGYRAGELLVTASGVAQSPAGTNVAAASNGATATASSTQSAAYPASSAINGDRKGLNWNAGGGWNDATANAYPDWLEVSFGSSKTISEISVFTLQDAPATPSEPTETMTFTQYGITAFDVQYWDGTQWLTVQGGSVTGNSLVWRKLTFAPVTTSKIRVVVNGALASYSRIVEIEAIQARANVALSSQGATVSASSTISANYPASSIINGDRKGINWNAGGGWNDATANAYPDWVQVDFSGTKSIDEIDVFTLQDTPASPVEPTESQTFTLYGITSFDVQYWDGSAWVTVPNGTVTGNDKVWRKFSFSPVTTNKIRVVVNNALASYSRIVEIEAFESAVGGTSSIEWLVADQLGTPRMVVDKTGALSGIKRHDYFAFGEEVASDAGGRTSGRGYVGDTVRQKFATYERDNETGLDYAGTRYYASMQGRFTSPDVFWKDSQVADPQSWNKYAYVRNNPLKYIDPTGEKATVTIETDEEKKRAKITVTATIALWTSKSSGLSQKDLQKAAQEFKKNMEESWGGSFDHKGFKVEVSVTVDVQAFESKDAANASFDGNVQNVLEVKPVGGDSFIRQASILGGPDRGQIAVDAGIRKSEAGHEFTHLLGVDNRLSGASLSNKFGAQRALHATDADYGWAFGDAIDSHRFASRPMEGGRLRETLNAGGGTRGKERSHTSTRELGAPIYWWR